MTQAQTISMPLLVDKHLKRRAHICRARTIATVACAVVLPVVGAAADAQLQRNVTADWQGRRLAPFGEATGYIVGPITVTPTSIAFDARKRRVPLRFLGERVAVWKEGGAPTRGYVYRVPVDPGVLVGGNRICRAGRPLRWLVFFTDANNDFGTLLRMASWDGKTPPTRWNSPRDCETDTFSLDEYDAAPAR